MSEAGIVVTGIGLRTSVGNSAEETAASVRAGVNRFAGWPDPAGGGPWVGAALWPDVFDLPWTDKLDVLLDQPWHEALWQAKVFDGAAERAQNGRIGVYLALPAGGRPEADPETLAETRTDGIAPLRHQTLELFQSDQAGGVEAIVRAQDDLAQGRVTVAVVAGVDSHLSTPWLEQLQAEHRLKSADGPAGLIPGEASGVLVLETNAHAAARKAPVLARLGRPVVGKEPVPIGPDHPIRAEALSATLRSALGGDAPRIGRVLVDLNGERWRFLEWAVAETRCCHVLPRGWQLQHPADCLGDVGAAFVPCAVVLATRSFARGAERQSGAVVVAVSMAGGRGAISVLPPTDTPAGA
jgi:3-oxoacyl-[acyl-carrier-protein] synthase-1